MVVSPVTVHPPDFVPVRRALISVFDKTGVVDFARALADRGVVIVSTGGTRTALEEAGIAVTNLAEVTGFPEIMDGRVKTLHPAVHGALLGVRDNPTHADAMTAHGIAGIDLLAVNLYPFAETVAGGADAATVVENIDIGGPAMIRAAAKNHAYVTVCVTPQDYDDVLADLDAYDGATHLHLRQRLAAKVFARTAAYDAAVATWFADEVREEAPEWRSFAGRLAIGLRYGENPHQSAALYLTGEKRPGVATGRQVQGKALSFNNINDTDAAFELVAEFDPDTEAAVAIIKHANPCGVAVGDNLIAAYGRALRTDPVSAFGGIVAVNRRLDAATAAEIVKVFTEVIVAPEADEEAVAIIAAKKNLRLLITDGLPDPRAKGLDVRSVAGGLLVQSRDNGVVAPGDLKVVTKRAPTETEMADLLFAWRVAKYVKSNAIVYAKDGATAGIGAGQMSRVDSAMIAARKAEAAAEAAGLDESLAIGAVVASDAFFPFADGLIATAEAGATAVIQPGGSVRDDEVIAAADDRGLAMVFTGMRHFRH
ncbi:bifunctional phosphoribosylaminoimidazolecarboxamide formyltransferase/IMP cyclohydrolase [Bauldia sp.]|uniref:bifunctional phosphoribosylaminoimidazolecarboxamide formyltransferase/IMP cyclohydrolase n=1 Tax=Bauldia sp. TaxID=2575872 RepID=UPI003BAA9679